MRLALVAVVVVAALATACTASPLYDYVWSEDPYYSYFDTGARIANATGWTGYVLNMTSQKWMTEADTDHPVWYHQLVVIVPDNLKYTNVSAIYVTGGSNGDKVPDAFDEDILVSALLATATGTVTATLFQVPNQPIVFASDPEKKHRGEDAFVAYTWVEFFRHPDTPQWVDLMPMVKSVVKAMDTVIDFAKNKGFANIEKFSIAGASKRGWTTWLTGAVDKRVIGIAPIVMDMLNFEKNVLHMYEAYGGWTFAFEDYYVLNITDTFGTPGLTALADIIDPLNYKENLTMPKIVVDSTGDEFFMPDDDWFWWGQLEGETYRLMVANAEHSMATGIVEALVGIDAFYMSLILQTPRPQMNWTVDHNSGQIVLTTMQPPTSVTLWTATTFDDKRRDFRLIKGNTPADPCKFIPVHIFGNACINPVIWWGESIAPVSKSGNTYTYVANQELPQSGWRGFFLEAKFPGPTPTSSFRLTTQVSIIPNVFPFEPCPSLPQGCHGQLV